MDDKNKAITILKELDINILVIGNTGSGKSHLLKEANIENSKYFDFPALNKGSKYIELCDENFDEFDFLNIPEKTLILDGVHISDNTDKSKLVRFIKTVRKYGKRIIVVSFPDDGERIKNLFGAVITLTRPANTQKKCATVSNYFVA